MMLWRRRSISPANSIFCAVSARRIAWPKGTGSIVTATVRTVALCISSGARKLGPTSERGHDAIQ